jgi:hypothetical protein
MFKSIKLMIGAAFLVLPLFLFAQIDVTGISGTWTSVTSGANITGLNTNKVFWGAPFQPDVLKSGFGFAAAPNLYNIAPNSTFVLGTFTHYNQEVPANTAITQANLNTQFTLAIENSVPATFNFQYIFNLNETPNIAGQCPAGSATVCDDIVTAVKNPNSSQNIVINGQTYIFDIKGFQVGNNVPLTQFLTAEDATTSAQLIGTFTLVAPEPSTYLVLGTLVGCIVLAKRRKVSFSHI